MAKSFLRSGSLEAVLPLGENGQPVYLSALQLRETLRLRKQQQIADCLAVPQPNDAGDRLDWYSPVSGKVTSWAAASESARAHALNQLIACQQAVDTMCQRAQQSDKPSQKLFGALLSRAMQFPDPNYVYLVGGKPVITFWGFVSPEKKARQDALECLRATEEEQPPRVLSKLTASKLAEVAPPAPVMTGVRDNPVVPSAPEAPQASPATALPASEALPVSPLPEPALSAQKPALKNSLLRYGWTLPAAALLVALGVQLKGCESTPPPSPAPQTLQPVGAQGAKTTTLGGNPTRAAEQSAAKESTPRPGETVETPPAVKPTGAVSNARPELPVSPSGTDAGRAAPAVSGVNAADPANSAKPALPVAAANALPAPVEQPAATSEAAAAIPVAKDDLVMPADAVKLGSTRFINGSWRVIVGGRNPITGRPPSLRYQMKNGKGTARIIQGDGISCRVDVYAGLMKSGNLVINSRTKAKCSDGSRYQMPELVCKQGSSGPAECSGQYDANTVLPMTMKRESK